MKIHSVLIMACAMLWAVSAQALTKESDDAQSEREAMEQKQKDYQAASDAFSDCYEAGHERSWCTGVTANVLRCTQAWHTKKECAGLSDREVDCVVKGKSIDQCKGKSAETDKDAGNDDAGGGSVVPACKIVQAAVKADLHKEIEAAKANVALETKEQRIRIKRAEADVSTDVAKAEGEFKAKYDKPGNTAYQEMYLKWQLRVAQDMTGNLAKELAKGGDIDGFSCRLEKREWRDTPNGPTSSNEYSLNRACHPEREFWVREAEGEVSMRMCSQSMGSTKAVLDRYTLAVSTCSTYNWTTGNWFIEPPKYQIRDKKNPNVDLTTLDPVEDFIKLASPECKTLKKPKVAKAKKDSEATAKTVPPKSDPAPKPAVPITKKGAK